MELSGVDHIGVVVDDLEEAKRFLAETLGLSLEREAEMEALGLKAAFYRCGPVMIEAVELVSSESPFRPLSDGAKARIDHIAVEVDDARGVMGELRTSGVESLEVGSGDEPLEIGGNLSYWTAPDTSDGVTYQLIQKGGG